MAQNNAPPPSQYYSKVQPIPDNGQMNDKNEIKQGQLINSNDHNNNKQQFIAHNNYIPQSNYTNSTVPPIIVNYPANYAQPSQNSLIIDNQYDKSECKSYLEIQQNNVQQRSPLVPILSDDQLPVGQMSSQGKRNFLIKVICLWNLQLIIQIILVLIILFTETLDKFFFIYRLNKHRFTFYIVLTTTIILFLIIRFVKVFRTNQIFQILMYSLFTLSYAFLLAACASGLHKDGLENQPFLTLFTLASVFVYILSALSLLILTIILLSWKDEPSFKKYSIRLIIGPILFAAYILIFERNFNFVPFLILYIISACWLLYFLKTVFKLLKGKFNLYKNDYAIGCLLTYSQMIIPED